MLLCAILVLGNCYLDLLPYLGCYCVPVSQVVQYSVICVVCVSSYTLIVGGLESVVCNFIHLQYIRSAIGLSLVVGLRMLGG